MLNQGLAKFERRLEEWESAYSMHLERGIDRIVDAHFKNADRIIVSQERIESGIDKIALELRDLRSAFMWCHLDLIWRLELQGETLKRILKALQPLGTKAKELRKKAEDAYINGRIDEALENFLELEKKNVYDFTVHQSIGNIYLFYKKDPKALNFYNKAVEYASKSECYHYAGLAYLHIGLVLYLLEDFQGAYEATSKAKILININYHYSPMLPEAHYHHARYCALLGKYDEAIEYLEDAIRENRYYCVKADNEKDFDVMKERLRLFFKDLRDKAQSYAKSEIEKAEELVRYAKVKKEKAEELIRGSKYYGVVSDKLLSAINELKEARTFLERGSLFDCWDAIPKARNAQRIALDSANLYFSIEDMMYVRTILDEIKFKKKVEKKVEKLALYSSIIIFPLTTFIIYSAIQILLPLPSRAPPGFYSLQAIADIIPSVCGACLIALFARRIIKKLLWVTFYGNLKYKNLEKFLEKSDYLKKLDLDELEYWLEEIYKAILAKVEGKLSELETKRSHFEIKNEGYPWEQKIKEAIE